MDSSMDWGKYVSREFFHISSLIEMHLIDWTTSSSFYFHSEIVFFFFFILLNMNQNKESFYAKSQVIIVCIENRFFVFFLLSSGNYESRFVFSISIRWKTPEHTVCFIYLFLTVFFVWNLSKMFFFFFGQMFRWIFVSWNVFCFVEIYKKKQVNSIKISSLVSPTYVYRKLMLELIYRMMHVNSKYWKNLNMIIIVQEKRQGQIVKYKRKTHFVISMNQRAFIFIETRFLFLSQLLLLLFFFLFIRIILISFCYFYLAS